MVREFGLLPAGAVSLTLLASRCVVRLTSGLDAPPAGPGGVAPYRVESRREART